MQTLVARLTEPNDALHCMADELLAYVDFRLGNAKASQSAYERLAKDPGTPEGIKARAAGMAAFIAAGGNRNVGVVPPPPAQPAAIPPAPATAPAKTP